MPDRPKSQPRAFVLGRAYGIPIAIRRADLDAFARALAYNRSLGIPDPEFALVHPYAICNARHPGDATD